MSDRERAICRRLRDFREETKLSQTAFAQALGIGSSRLATYEHERVPVRYELAKRAGEKFGLNICWLAEGVGPMTPHDPVHPALEEKIPPRSLLSEAYDRFLKALARKVQEMRADWNKIGGTLNILAPLGVPVGEGSKYAILKAVRSAVDAIPSNLQSEYFHALMAASNEFGKKHKIPIKGIFQRFRSVSLETKGLPEK
jgi:transcriptional regulator with XRE-family HTH domain